MGAEQAHYPDRQRVNKLITNLVILLSLKYLPTEMAVFVWKKNCSKSSSDDFRPINQSCFCTNVFPTCNINSRSFPRSGMSAFLCSSKILSIISCICNLLSWNDCNWFYCNSSSCCWNELFGFFSLTVFLFFPPLVYFSMFSNSSSSFSSMSLFPSNRLFSSGI